MKARTSTAYEFTIDLIDGKPAPHEVEKLEKLKQHVKWYNARVKKESSGAYPFYNVGKHKIRITMHGRLGPNNPAAEKYRNSTMREVALADAVRADVYINRRGD